MRKASNIHSSQAHLTLPQNWGNLKTSYKKSTSPLKSSFPILQGASLKTPYFKWKARPILETDLGILYDRVFGNSDAMKLYERGVPFLREELERRFQIWNQDLQAGYPKGAFLITDKQDKCMGYFLVAEMDQPGVAKLAYAYNLSYASQGLASSVTRFFVEKWAANIARISHGLSRNSPLRKNFHCFQGEYLQKLYVMARPANPASWSIVEQLGFQPAKDFVVENNQNIILNYYNPRVNRDNKADFLTHLQEMEKNILDYFHKNAGFEEDKKYLMIDLEGKERVFSYVSSHQQISWHFEYLIP